MRHIQSAVNHAECAAANVDPARVARIASRLAKCAMEAHELGLVIFAGGGGASVRDNQSERGQGQLILAEVVGGYWDGGDGGARTDAAGLLRGEA